MQGKTISGYTLKNHLGTGGMAEVWYAENAIGKKAAVKLLLPKFCADENIVARFENEAKVMVQLEHPNIRQVYDYGSIDGRPSIVMEYLEGNDLKTLMKSGRRFTDEELRKWWNQIADALNYTHAQGIIHRDIKPSNLFLDKKGNVKLLDFGIAKIRESISMTQTGAMMGTLLYMSPEQVEDSKHIGPQSDIYSLAVTFVHLLTGKAPYDSTTSSDYAIRKGIVEVPLDLTSVPAQWQGFLNPYLEKDPTKRPALKPFEEVAAEAMTPEPVDEGTIVSEAPKKQETPAHEPKETEPQPTAKPETRVENNKPKSKKGLWIGLAIAAVAAIMAVLLWPRDPYKKIDQWLNESERIFGTCLEATITDYSDDIAQLNEGYDYCTKASQALSGMKNKDAEVWTPRMNRCDSFDADYVQKVSAFVEYELDNLRPDQDTTAIIGRLRQLEEFNYIKMNVDDNGMLERMEKEIGLRKKELVFTVSGVSFTMKPVGGGTFQMGAQKADTSGQNYDPEAYNFEQPVHSVTVSTFYMGETEVTQALWEAVMGTTVSQQRDMADKSFSLRGEGNNYPMYYISWNECQEFIGKLNLKTGKTFRLPTEAEWEYAARGGKKGKGYKYAGSNTLGDVAWFGQYNGETYDNGNSGENTHVVKTKSPNELGLYDMSGNVWEWCSDRYGSYDSGSQTNPTGPSSGSFRVLRGGSWGSRAGGCRVSYRGSGDPSGRSGSIGFRLCLPQ